jgi:glycosyltransferase involved in cell wall biosynthesis
MIRAGLDVTALAHSPHGGIAQVCYHTLNEAVRHADIGAEGYYRSGRPTEKLQSELPLRKLGLTTAWRLKPFDIAHGLCHRLPRMKGRRIVYTLHDVWSLYPNKYQSAGFQKQIGARMRRELIATDCIITNSETTRDNLMNLDLVRPEKVHVSHLGVTLPAPDKDIHSRTGISELIGGAYVLFVGRLEYRKNLPHVIEAVRRVSSLHVVLVGEPGFDYKDDVIPYLGRMDSERLHVFSRLSDEHMSGLYQNAVATLLPSWEEGFGLPILEAMSHGSPVITSNRSASAEVAQQAAVLVDPSDPTAGREAIIRLLDDSSYRSMLIQAGRERAAGFTWRRYFDRVVEIYKSVL